MSRPSTPGGFRIIGNQTEASCLQGRARDRFLVKSQDVRANSHSTPHRLGVDGRDKPGHDGCGGIAHDAGRDAHFAELGFLTLRFWNPEIDENLDGVVETIMARAHDTRGAQPKGVSPWLTIGRNPCPFRRTG
ncbi:hypothetical protein B1812_18335 [Methylocystis bryophila]|uniref:DUF559 domain-containing protein n=1 Tax=Methylocystis bryophila TaxID=655015 RepID=A0A1W6MYS0_9HYPH|nr:hypothetical protein B1812_18335 [Methylocystis bryophila]